MPNTLAHLGVNSLATRGLIRGAELPWIYVGCVIPDFPWIVQRVVKTLIPQVDAYDLRLYAANQASLGLSLVLAASMAAVSVAWRRVFAILSFGCLLHLLLDACQIKWGNGVGLFVPFDWRMIRFDVFWPESLLTSVLTLGGLGWFLATLRAARRSVPRFTVDIPRWLLGLLLAVAYIVLPAAWIPRALAANNHFVATLRSGSERTGRALELDRAAYQHRAGHPVLVTFAGEPLQVIGIDSPQDSVVSVRGVFLTPDTLDVHDFHVHRAGVRDAASYVGLCLVAGLWLSFPFTRLRQAAATQPASR